MGREFDGILRTTFLIGPDSQIIRSLRMLNPQSIALRCLLNWRSCEGKSGLNVTQLLGKPIMQLYSGLGKS